MIDYINRENLPERKEHWGDDFETGWNCCLDAINSVPALNAIDILQEQWIPVLERYPDEMELVIVTDGANVGISFCVNNYGTMVFYLPWDITHWMPLPLPPKEES